jgi:hypothetical protein
MKYLPPILFALLLLAGGFAIWSQDRQIQALQATVGSAGDRASLQRRVDDLTQQLKAAQGQLASARPLAADKADGQSAAGSPSRSTNH